MVLEAAVLALIGTRFRRKVALVAFALSITVLATAYNLFVSGKLLAVGVMPLWSMLAVGFGGYIAVFEWRLLQQLRAGSPRNLAMKNTPDADEPASGAQGEVGTRVRGRRRIAPTPTAPHLLFPARLRG